MGTPVKPAPLRAISGTRRKLAAPVVSLPPLDEAPAPPDWLPNGHAVAEWHRLSRILVANRLLTAGSLGPLGVLCALHGRLVQQLAAGQTPLAAMLAQRRALSNDFGLTPAAQGRVQAAPDQPAGNAFARNGKPPASPGAGPRRPD